MRDNDYLDLYGTAQRARRRYPCVRITDYIHEGDQWVQRHPELHARCVDQADFYKINRRLWGHLEWYGLQQTARTFGYKPEDVYFYNLDVIDNTLPGLWDEQYTGLPAEYEEVRAKRDAADGNNWPALLGDVSRAYARASTWTQETLYSHYVLSVPVREDLDAALKELRDLLGGVRPQGCSMACEECGNG